MSKAGSAKSEKFNLGCATVMIGPKENVLDLTPEKHSIGLVKNFTFSSNDTYLDLTQGVTNTVVYSVKTGSEITASMEVYEYTSKNLAYALGLEGYELVEGANLTLKEAVNGDMVSTEIKVAADEDSSSDDFMEGDHIIIQGNKSKNEDLVYVGKVASVEFEAGSSPQVASSGTVLDLMRALKEANDGVAVLTIEKGKMKVLAGAEQSVTVSEKFGTVFGISPTTGTGPQTGSVAISAKDVLSTLGFADGDVASVSIGDDVDLEATIKDSPATDTSAYFTITVENPIPEGFNFIAGDRVHKANLIPVGSPESQPTLAAKVVGILPEGKAPITIIIPKLRITNGFNLSFQTDQYGNMPFEFTPYEQVPSDPLYKEYGDQGFAFLLD